ncbi:MAG: aminodeoxychorismate synthase component I [Thermodesulfovibrionales bacterium]
MSIARYSFIAVDPYLTFSVQNGEVRIRCRGRETISSRKPLQRLREIVGAYPQKRINSLPPFQGGAIGFLGYDFVRYFERLPDAAADDLTLPDALFFLVDTVISFDHQERRAWIVACPGARDTVLGYSPIEKTDEELHVEAAAMIRRVEDLLEKTPPEPRTASRVRPVVVQETPKEQYTAMVRRAKEYIAAGDIFQANLSLRIRADIGKTEPWSVYETLRKVNPSPFAFFMDCGEFQIASSSPERLVRCAGGRVDTRPIAGTRPRGRDTGEDELLRAELLLNAKERAEHIMLIDLERNDIGRVCSYGSVTVDELMTTEEYSHVIHIVSNVQGRLAPGKDCFSVIRAAFPGGTITGVPKVRCMEIIEELEARRRGVYTGSAGYIGFNGDMDLNIIIRTFLIKDGMAYVQAGAGIVADSDPEREHAECLKKAEALVRTLERL